MVNLIMRVTGDETLTMSRSFLMKKYNYSHCPLKKRPVQYIKEERYDVKDLSDDNSEPENLSTKPEDLSKSCKTLTPPPAVALISIKKENEEELGSNVHCNQPTERAFGRYLSKSSGGPLEPLNLNTAVNTHEPPTTPQWPRAVPAHYPPHYIPLNYIYPQHDVLPYYYSSATAASPSPPRISAEPVVSPYAAAAAAAAVHDPCSSPPRHAFAPFRSHVPVIAALPHCGSGAESRLYRPQAGDHSPLSPTSTTSSNSYPYYADPSPPPPVSPEDLSSPGSVSSLCGDSSSVGSSIGGSGSGRTTVTTASSCTSVGAGAKKKCKDALQRYKCTYCAKSYSTYSGLSKHQQFHCSANEDAAAKKKFKCKYCEKEYNSLGALKMHIRTHTLPCKCTQCGKAFSRPWLLQGHIRTHTGEKPFSCPHCNRAFADRSNLRAHLQTHSDVKKYSCPTCSKTFSRMSLLSKHTDGGCPGVSGGVIRVTDDIKSFYINN